MKLKPDVALEQAKLHLRRAKDRMSRGMGLDARAEIDAALEMLAAVKPVLRVKTEGADA